MLLQRLSWKRQYSIHLVLSLVSWDTWSWNSDTMPAVRKPRAHRKAMCKSSGQQCQPRSFRHLSLDTMTSFIWCFAVFAKHLYMYIHVNFLVTQWGRWSNISAPRNKWENSRFEEVREFVQGHTVTGELGLWPSLSPFSQYCDFMNELPRTTLLGYLSRRFQNSSETESARSTRVHAQWRCLTKVCERAGLPRCWRLLLPSVHGMGNVGPAVSQSCTCWLGNCPEQMAEPDSDSVSYPKRYNW